MAEKRMFSRSIICTDAFTELTHRARCLYFYLCLAADDVGVVANPGAVMLESLCGAGDMKALTDSGYVVRLKNSLVLIRHWFVNNAIRSERMKPTQYAAALKGVICDPNSRAYIMPGEEGNPAQEGAAATQDGRATVTPDVHPTATPDGRATATPDGHPTATPDGRATATPDGHPTWVPECHPTGVPDGHPTMAPSCHPTWAPTCHPTWVPACAQTVPVEERSIDKINIKEERGEREEERETTELSHSFYISWRTRTTGKATARRFARLKKSARAYRRGTCRAMCATKSGLSGASAAFQASTALLSEKIGRLRAVKASARLLNPPRAFSPEALTGFIQPSPGAEGTPRSKAGKPAKAILCRLAALVSATA